MPVPARSLLALLRGDEDPARLRTTLYPHLLEAVARALDFRAPDDVPPEWEDVVQEAALQATENVVRYRRGFRGATEGEARAWLRVVARNAARTRVRREGRRRRMEVAVDPTELNVHADAVSPGDAPGSSLSAEGAMRLLEFLVPNDDWRAIWLLHNDPRWRLDIPELARHFDRTPGTVAVTLSRVRKAIAMAFRA
jgi:DNA-directed RNA polymerase specialized sigma24 family protein